MYDNHKFINYCTFNNHQEIIINEKAQLIPKISRNYFFANEYASIYNMPSPNLTSDINVAVVSFGGGLFGSLSNSGILTNSDCSSYWQYLGIPSTDMPKVVVKTVGGALNNPQPNDGGTIENTIDVQMIGACCPSSKLTIVLYIAPNSFSSFTNVLNTILNDTFILLLLYHFRGDIMLF
jgi:subtilase family serine protease